jgi:hypothetical protein
MRAWKIPDLFLVLNMISHSFAALTRVISCSIREINLVFPRTHACIILYNYSIHGFECNLKKTYTREFFKDFKLH